MIAFWYFYFLYHDKEKGSIINLSRLLGREEKKVSVASASPEGRIFKKNVTISEGFFTLYDKFEAKTLARVVFAREKY